MNFTVSVVIPAYNVAAFVSKAVFSALQQTEVVEVLFVDDGSTDETLKLALNLQKKDSRVKVFQHDKGKNLGRSASRNLGIQRATGNYIAFLDADDFYLDNRFSQDQEILSKDSTIHGVYNAVGYEFYRTIVAGELNFLKDNTLTQTVPADQLFEALISCKYGYLHLNGLTVKRKVFDDVGFFNEALVVAEDSDFIFRLSLSCKLEASNISTLVAKRGIHEQNIFDKKDLYTKYNPVLYEELVRWCLKNKIAFCTIDSIFKYYWIIRYRENKTIGEETIYWMCYLIRNPTILFSKYSLKYMPIIRLRQKLFPFLYSLRHP